MSFRINHSGKVLLARGKILFELTAENTDKTQVFAFLVTGEREMKQLERDCRDKDVIDYMDYGQLAHSGTGKITDYDRELAKAIAAEIMKRAG